jgi:YD repeat-containing protein
VKALTQGGSIIKRLPRWAQFVVLLFVVTILGAYFLLPLIPRSSQSETSKTGSTKTSVSSNSAPVTSGEGINISGNSGPVTIHQQSESTVAPSSSTDELRAKSIYLPSGDPEERYLKASKLAYLDPFTRVLLNRDMSSGHFAFLSCICREVRYTKNPLLHDWLCSVANFCSSLPGCPAVLKDDLEDSSNMVMLPPRQDAPDILETFLEKLEEVVDTHDNSELFLSSVLKSIQDEEKRIRQEYRHHKLFLRVFKRFIERGKASETFLKLVEDFHTVRISSVRGSFLHDSYGDVSPNKYCINAGGDIDYWRYSWNSSEQQISHIDADSCDLHGTLVSSLRDKTAIGHTYAYDQKGNLTSKTSDSGTIHYEYDLLGRLTSTTISNRVKFGEPAQKREAIAIYQYDEMGRIISISRPVHGTTTLTYDENGNLTSASDSEGRTITFRYDSSSGCLSASRPGGLATSYVYDSAGNRVYPNQCFAVANREGYDCSGSVKLAWRTKEGYGDYYCWKKIGFCQETLTPHSKRIVSTSFDYDSHGRIIYSSTGQSLSGAFKAHLFEYDSQNRLSSVLDIGREGVLSTCSYVYSTDGKLIKIVAASLNDESGKLEAVCERRPRSLAIGANTRFNNVLLKYARNDALRVFSQLSRESVDHLLITDGIESEDHFKEIMQGEDISLKDSEFIFFSGHGATVPDKHRLFAISDDSFLAELTLRKLAPKAEIVADACTTPLVESYCRRLPDSKVMYESERLKGGLFTAALLRDLETRLVQNRLPSGVLHSTDDKAVDSVR